MRPNMWTMRLFTDQYYLINSQRSTPPGVQRERLFDLFLHLDHKGTSQFSFGGTFKTAAVQGGRIISWWLPNFFNPWKRFYGSQKPGKELIELIFGSKALSGANFGGSNRFILLWNFLGVQIFDREIPGTTNPEELSFQNFGGTFWAFLWGDYLGSPSHKFSNPG